MGPRGQGPGLAWGRNGGARAKIRESNCPPISKIGPHWPVKPLALGETVAFPDWGGVGGSVSWAPGDAECAPQESANFK